MKKEITFKISFLRAMLKTNKMIAANKTIPKMNEKTEAVTNNPSTVLSAVSI